MWLKEMAELLRIPCTENPFIEGFCVDTRLLKGNNIFFALPGAKVDGHAFIAEVAAKKGSAAVVKKDFQGSGFGLPLIRVDDPMETMQNLARVLIVKSQTKVIGITGSVGKTTTKEFVAGLLKNKYNVWATPGNCNSQIGLPLSILNNFRGSEDAVVLEMGMTHPGQIQSLVNIAPPSIAILTSAALVHSENFESLEAIAQEKAAIFSHSQTRLGILHHEIVNCMDIKMRGECKKVTFSIKSADADFFLESNNQEWNILTKRGSQISCNPLKLPGKHNQLNFLAASIAANCLGMSWQEIREAMTTLCLPDKRLQHEEKNGVLFVNDAYNASEISVKAALAMLPSPVRGGKRYAVLGEMLELGKFSEQCHTAVAEHALEYVDEMLCCGNACEPIHRVWTKAGKPILWRAERSELLHYLQENLKSGDVVLLKGSRSKEMWKILDEIYE